MNNIQEIPLDIRDNHTYQQLYTKQYDYGSSIIFHITKNGKPFEIEGAKAVFSMKKPDNHVIENMIDVVDGKIAIDITEQMTSSYGKAKFSITLFKDDISITTITGIMKIDEAVIHPEDIESSDEYNIVVDILNKVIEAESAVNTAIKKVEEASDFVDATKTSATNAANSASTAIEKANEAAESASNAANSAIIATDKANDSNTAAGNASASADSAANSANLASTKATEASNSANTATIKATEATNSATNAQNYAIGDTDSSKYYYEQVKTISESLSGALRPIGTITFANLPSLESALEGDMYNISDEFTTNENFKEGTGNVIPAGANVYKTSDGYWDILAGTPVTSVNGQRGNVNITSESIGALTTDGDSAENTVTYTSEDNLTANAWTDVAALTSNEKHSSIFNKVSKMFKNVRYIWKLLGTTDISTIGNGTITGAVSSLNGDLANTNTAINTLNTGLNNANTAIGKKQDASTAITTSNISMQSVNYAVTAGAAGSAVDQTARKNADAALATSYSLFNFSSTDYFTAYGNQVVYKIGRCISIIMVFGIKKSVGVNGVITTIPSGYCPNWNIGNMAIINIENNNVYSIKITTTGVVSANVALPIGKYFLYYTYPGQL